MTSPEIPSQPESPGLMIPIESRAAIVICGGASRRMGTPKAQLKLGDMTFLEAVVRTVSEVCGVVVVVAGPDQDLPPLHPNVRVVRDRRQQPGPLAAIAAGLSALPRNSRIVFLTGCDTPLIRSGLVEALFRFADGHDVAIPVLEDHPQPLTAVYRIEPARRLCFELLSKGTQRVMDLPETLDSRVIPADVLRNFDPSLVSFRNVNTQEDYRALLTDVGLALTESPPDS